LLGHKVVGVEVGGRGEEKGRERRADRTMEDTIGLPIVEPEPT
jgi:hypothetical protein